MYMSKSTANLENDPFVVSGGIHFISLVKCRVVLTGKINAILLIIEVLIFKVSSSMLRLLFLKPHSDIMFLNKHTSKSGPCLLLLIHSDRILLQKTSCICKLSTNLYHFTTAPAGASQLHIYSVRQISACLVSMTFKIFLFIWY